MDAMTSLHPTRADGRTLCITQRLVASPADAFTAWVHPALVRRWLFATADRPLPGVQVDAREGGELVLRDRWQGRDVAWHGAFVQLARPGALAFTLTLPDAPEIVTHVAVSLVPTAVGCRVAVVHAGVPAACAEAMEARWQGALYGLAETLAALPVPCPGVRAVVGLSLL